MAYYLRTAKAEEDLIKLWLYLADFNPDTADAMLDRLDEMFGLLALYPSLGPLRPDLAPELRYFVVQKYLILYRALEDGIEIVRVVYGARNLADLFWVAD